MIRVQNEVSMLSKYQEVFKRLHFAGKSTIYFKLAEITNDNRAENSKYG